MTWTRMGLGTGVLGLLALAVVGTYWGTMALGAYSQAELDAATEEAHQSGYNEGQAAGYAKGQAAAQSTYDSGYAEGYAAAQTKDLSDIKTYLPLLLLAAYNRGASSAPIYTGPSSVSCSSYAIGDWLRTNCYGW